MDCQPDKTSRSELSVVTFHDSETPDNDDMMKWIDS